MKYFVPMCDTCGLPYFRRWSKLMKSDQTYWKKIRHRHVQEITVLCTKYIVTVSTFIWLTVLNNIQFEIYLCKMTEWSWCRWRSGMPLRFLFFSVWKSCNTCSGRKQTHSAVTTLCQRCVVHLAFRFLPAQRRTCTPTCRTLWRHSNDEHAATLPGRCFQGQSAD